MTFWHTHKTRGRAFKGAQRELSNLGASADRAGAAALRCYSGGPSSEDGGATRSCFTRAVFGVGGRRWNGKNNG